jgi:hypothetical protein
LSVKQLNQTKEMKELIQNLRACAGKAQFASLLYTTKTKQNKKGEVVDGGETSRFNLVLGAKYLNLLEKSLLAAQVMTSQDLIDLFGAGSSYLGIAEQSRLDVISSLEKSIAAHKAGTQNEDYTKKDQYAPLGGGLNLNENDCTLQLFGLVQSKVVIKPGVYKSVNSAPETIAKNLIRKSLPIGKFREFALDLGNVHLAKLQGNVLVIE